MEHIGIKLSIPSGVTTVDASTHVHGQMARLASSSQWVSMPWPKVEHGKYMESTSRLGLGTIY